jgi:hypothetical protein
VNILESLEHDETIRLTRNTLYPKDAYVAKSCDQVGRRTDRTIAATDGGVFERISQAINSARDLISQAHDLEVDQDYFTLVCPVLVVPDSTLWQVKYSDDGARVGPPEPISRTSYFIGKEWTVGGKLDSMTYSISHLEILTFSEIRDFVTKYLWNYVKQCNSAASRDSLD